MPVYDHMWPCTAIYTAIYGHLYGHVGLYMGIKVTYMPICVHVCPYMAINISMYGHKHSMAGPDLVRWALLSSMLVLPSGLHGLTPMKN